MTVYGGHAHLDPSTGLVADPHNLPVGVPYIFGLLGSSPKGATRFLNPGSGASNTNEICVSLPRDGKLRNLQCAALEGPGTKGSDVVRVRLNRQDTKMQVQLTGSGEQMASNRTVTPDVKTNDKLSISLTTHQQSTLADMTVLLEWTLI